MSASCDVALVGIGPAGDPRDLTTEGHATIEHADILFYRGTRLPSGFSETYRERLVSEPELQPECVLRAGLSARDKGRFVAMLFQGDGTLFSGHPTRGHLSQQRLASFLQDAGLRVKQVPAVSPTLAAIAAAGWSVPSKPTSSLTIAAPFCDGPDGAQELDRLARGPSTLALAWCEEYGSLLYRTLLAARGGAVRTALVHALRTPNEKILEASLELLETEFTTLRAPTVVLVQAPDELPQSLIEAARAWASGVPAGITWLLAPPAAGKTTWLEALAVAAPDLELLELGAWLHPLLRNDGRTPGGRQLLATAARLLREHALQRPDGRRVIAATQLPDEVLPSRGDPFERLVVLSPEAADHESQRSRRPCSRAAEIESLENARLDEWHKRLQAQRSDVARLTVPFRSELLGRLARGQTEKGVTR